MSPTDPTDADALSESELHILEERLAMLADASEWGRGAPAYASVQQVQSLIREVRRERARLAGEGETLTRLRTLIMIDDNWGNVSRVGTMRDHLKAVIDEALARPAPPSPEAPDPLAKVLHDAKATLDAASDERYAFLKEREAESEKWKAEGDMYGWNFHQGMAAGANWCDIFYRRVARSIDAALSHPLLQGPAGEAPRSQC